MGRLLTALSRKTGINKLMLALPCLPSPGKHRPSVSTGELRKLAPDRGSTAVREKSRAGFVHDRFDLAIIVPVYQAESYLYQCVESLVNQKTEFQYQIILVDDGTTDRSFEKIASFLSNEKISVIHQENRGPSAARNRGIDSAQASYLCFVDSDDFVDALMVERLMKRAIQTGADVVVGNFSYYHENTGRITKNRLEDGRPKNIYDLYGITCAKVYHSRLFERVQFPEGNLYEDSIVKHLLLPMAGEIQCVSEPVYYYRIREKSRSQTAKSDYRCVDSTWITFRMAEDRRKLGIEKTSQYRNYYLRQIAMNFQRQAILPEKMKREIFILTSDAVKQEFPKEDRQENSRALRRLHRALLSGDYKTYRRICFWI